MGRKKVLKVPIYNITITLYVGKPPKHLETSRLGSFHIIDDSTCEVWVKDMSHLLHECFHVVVWIMGNKGCKLTDDSDEAYAYLLEYIYNGVQQLCTNCK
jgi:hypothetical protein